MTKTRRKLVDEIGPRSQKLHCWKSHVTAHMYIETGPKSVMRIAFAKFWLN